MTTKPDHGELKRAVDAALAKPIDVPKWVKPPFNGGFYRSMFADHARMETEAVERFSNGDWIARGAEWLRSQALYNGPPQGSFHHVCNVIAIAMEAQRDAILAENEALRAALERTRQWLKTSVPIGTEAATTMLGVIAAALEGGDRGRPDAS